ncbi:MAG: thioredoxin family protein [Gracilimonas sp.]|nr:thioredoxin family protein [Gracilimonas sp.]
MQNKKKENLRASIGSLFPSNSGQSSNPVNKIIIFVSMFTMVGFFVATPLSAQEKELNWTSFEKALELAEEQRKPIMVDVWAPWCGWCKKMQKEVYPELATTLNNDFILTRLNRDDNESRKQFQQLSLTPLRLAQKFNVQNVPAVVLLTYEGEYLFHISGYMEAGKLEEVLGYADLDRAERHFR